MNIINIKLQQKYTMKILLLILSILPGALLAQVGINTTTPTKTLDVNGEMRIRTLPTGNNTDQILVVDNLGNVKKVSLSLIQTTNCTCPTFLKSQSSGYHIKFSSSSSVPNPTSSLTIQGKNFTYAGAHISNNMYFFSWSNITGQPINIDNFSVTFTNYTCIYQ